MSIWLYKALSIVVSIYKPNFSKNAEKIYTQESVCTQESTCIQEGACTQEGTCTQEGACTQEGDYFEGVYFEY
jgi:hypothetical protein